MYKKKSTRSGLENIIVVKMLHVVLARTIVEQLELIFVFLWLRVCVKSRNPMDPNLSRSLTAFFATAERLKPSAIEMHHAFLLCMSTMYLPLQQFFCQVRVHRPWPTHSKHGKLVEAVRLITRDRGITRARIRPIRGTTPAPPITRATTKNLRGMIGTLKSLKRNLRSPQTNRKQELQLPADFRPDGQCLDSRELFGRKFFKQVQLTNWSQKHGLAGREISELKLHELGFGGWSNFYLRHLSAGAVTTIVFCRKIKSCWQQDFCQQFVSPRGAGILIV